MELENEGKLTLALLGPTAIGKTAIAIALAREFPVLRLISVDSVMVYRGLNIGSGKPEPEILQAIPHDLIDIREPWETYSAADFCRDAKACIQSAHAQGQIPFLVGGTFLYFKALMNGLSDLPPAQAEVRAEIERRANALGWPALHDMLMQMDPVSAQRIKPLDRQRITRALEVFEVTGKPLSTWFSETSKTPLAASESIGQMQAFVLLPPSRVELHKRIEQRFELMMQQGFLEEVRTLLANPQIHLSLPSMKSVGYRQLAEYVSNSSAPHPTLDETKARAIAATRQLAKRQLTWLRSLPELPSYTEPSALIKALRSHFQA